MSAIAHAFAERNTVQTTTGGYGDVTGVSIASGSFTAGKKYLVCVTAQTKPSVNSLDCAIRVVHGSTAFADSEHQDNMVAADQWGTYQFFTVWTAVDAEGLKVQFGITSGSGTLSINFVSLLVINLSDDLVENTDWHFAEDTGDDSLTTTPNAGAAITFTPPVAGHDWLVCSLARLDPTSTSERYISRLTRSGEASETVPEAKVEPVETTPTGSLISLSRVYNLGNASNTFTEHSYNSNSGHTRLYSAVFALNLDKFKNHSAAWTEADVALSATAYATQTQTLSINPTVESDVWIGSYVGFDRANAARTAKMRVQVDGTDQPAGQTTAASVFNPGDDSQDEIPLNLSTLVAAMTTGAKTVDQDASTSSTVNTPAAQHRQLWAVTMELAAAGGEISATLNATLGALTGSIAGAVAIAAAVTKTLGALGSSATAKVDVQASFSKTLGDLTADIDAAVAIAASVNKQLGDLTPSIQAAVEVQGGVNKTLSDLVGSIAGQVAIVATVSKTLGDAVLDAEGVIGNPPITGTLDKTLGALLSSAEVDVLVQAAVSKTLDPLTVVAAGKVDNFATLAKTLDALTAAIAAKVDVSGSVSKTLAALSGVVTGAVDVKAELIKTLGGLLLDAEGTVGVEDLPAGDKYRFTELGQIYALAELAAQFSLEEAGPIFELIEASE